MDFNPNYHFLSVSLYPYGLRQLFNLNASNLVNNVIELEAYPRTKLLLELFRNKREIDIPFVQKLTQTISSFPLYSVSYGTKEFIKATENRDIHHSVHLIAKKHGIGLRTLQRNFKSEVGITPKDYLRIIRMNRIEQRLIYNPGMIELVSDFDFTDQSHLIREVKQWRKYSPNVLIKKKLLLSDQLPVPDFIHI